LNENPIQWAQTDVCPCPCNHAYFRQLMNYAKVLRYEEEGSKLPYSRMQLVAFMTENEKRAIRKKKQKEIPLSQERLFV
jgi:hypothetical protein